MKGYIRYLAVKVFRFHLPLFKNGKNHGSTVIRLFEGKADRTGTPGPVIAIEFHIRDLKDAIKNGAVWYDKNTKRMHATLWKGGPGELRRLAYRLLEVADAVEKAWAMGVKPDKLEAIWISVRKNQTAKTKTAPADDDLDIDIDDDVDVETGEVDVFD